MHPRLRKAINIWLNAKERFNGEKRIPGSEKLTALKLSAYRSRKFHGRYMRHNGAPVDVFLVGDAAFGVPFFRALNNGIMCGSHLAHTLAKLIDKQRQANLTVVGSFFQKISRVTPMGSFIADKLQLGLTNIGHKV